MRDTNGKFCYIGRRPCGCVMAITTDNRGKDTARAVAEMIENGATVNRHSWNEYKEISKEETFLACPHGQLTLTLVE